MYCPACGHANPEDSKFCMRCGSAIPKSQGSGRGQEPRRVSIGISSSAGYLSRTMGRLVSTRMVGPVAIIAVVLIGGWVGFGNWNAARREGAYSRGVSAMANREWERAVAELEMAGNYLDAGRRLEQARQPLARVLPLYNQAQGFRERGEWWDTAYNLRQVTDQATKFRDADAQLAEARGKIGSLLYSTTTGGRKTLWLSVADGSKPTELVAGTNVEVWMPESQDTLVTKVTDGQRQTLYLSAADGSNRRELGTGKDIRFGRDSWSGATASQRIARLDETFGFSNDGTLLWFSAGDGSRTTDYVVDVRTGERRQASASTSSNASFILGFSNDLNKALVVSAQGNSGEYSLSVAEVTTGNSTEAIRTRLKDALLSPDGARVLAMLSEEDTRSRQTGTSIRLVDVASRTPLKVGSGPVQDALGLFSPDGLKLLLFQKQFSRSLWDLILVDVINGTSKPLLDNLNEVTSSSQFFLPGSTVAVIHTSESTGSLRKQTAYIVDAGTGASRELASGEILDVTYLKPASRLTLFVQEQDRSTGRLFLVDPGDLSRSEVGTGASGTVTSSPDGKRLAVVTAAQGATDSSREKLVIMEPNGANAVQIATGGEISGVAFSPNGTGLAYSQSTSPGGTPSIFIASLDGKRKEKVVDGARLERWLAPATQSRP